MKKKIFAVLLCVALIACLSVGLAACNKDKSEPAKASNAETLGTTVAMIANSAAGASASAAEESATAEAGVNLSFGTDAASIAASAAFSGVSTYINSCLQYTVNSVETFVNENGVKVETLAKDNAEFVADSDYTIKVSVTYTDEKENAVTDVYLVTVDTNGADIEGKTSFDFTVKVISPAKEEGKEDVELLSVSGTATYSEDVDGLKFGFGADLGVIDANVSAYATKEGTIAVVLNAKAGALGAGVSASVNVELGKLADNKYGADVTVVAAASVLNNNVTATVNVSVIAEKAETTHDFAVNGKVAVKIEPSVGSNNYVVSATISGNATYNSEKDEYVVSATGNAAVNTEAKPAESK